MQNYQQFGIPTYISAVPVDYVPQFYSLALPIKKQPIKHINQLVVEHSSDDADAERTKVKKDDLKERNRMAAQKWRNKKEAHLYELEDLNDKLRIEVFNLQSKAKQMMTENRVLENELAFFQKFMSKIMTV